MAENRSKSDGFMLRFPPGLRDRLKAAAEANGRSLNSEIVARVSRVISPDADGWIRIWLPPDLIERIEAKASEVMTTPEVLIREAIEEAFPYVPTLRDYVRELRKIVDEAGEDADAGLWWFVRETEQKIEEYPELGDRPLQAPRRGWEEGPEE